MNHASFTGIQVVIHQILDVLVYFFLLIYAVWPTPREITKKILVFIGTGAISAWTLDADVAALITVIQMCVFRSLIYAASCLALFIEMRAKFAHVHAEFFSGYDYIVIDTNPSMGIINKNAFFVADEILLVSDVSPNAVDGCELFLGKWEDEIYDLCIENKTRTLILNNLDIRTKTYRYWMNRVHSSEELNPMLCDTSIPNSTRFRDCELNHMPINLLFKKKPELERQLGYELSGCDRPAEAMERLYKELCRKGVL